MSFLSAVLAWLTSPATSAAATVVKASGAPSLSEIDAVFAAIQKFPFADVGAALKARFANVPADLVAGEDIAKALSDFGVPFAGDALVTLKVIGFIYAVTPDANRPGPFIVPGPGFQTPMHGGRGAI